MVHTRCLVRVSVATVQDEFTLGTDGQGGVPSFQLHFRHGSVERNSILHIASFPDVCCPYSPYRAPGNKALLHVFPVPSSWEQGTATCILLEPELSRQLVSMCVHLPVVVQVCTSRGCDAMT